MKTIEITDEMYEQIKDELGERKAVEIRKYSDLVGGKYFFRGVTYHLVGKVESQIGSFLRLSDASWVADSGRFMQAIAEGKLSEVEPVGDAFINLDAVVDFFPWKHKLPKEQK